MKKTTLVCEECGVNLTKVIVINALYNCPRCAYDSDERELMKVRARAVVEAFDDDQNFDSF